ncbi:MAG: FecR domain-containing protein [Verrucomicrobia bacterium]|nr:FecR domain-containing protein [Verrucomicrobiota bacterium]
MKIFSTACLLAFGFAFSMLSLSGQFPADGTGKGALIIVSKDGPTRFLDLQGSPLPAGKTTVGAALSEGYVAQAGVGGKIVLLLSNGTVITLESQTKLMIREFSQEPFDAAGRKVSDLVEEPSKSNVKLDLDWGSIVVATKKLDKGSRLNIHSPTGTAGIRGTQFQMSQNPGIGVKLDVSESTVAFTSPGAAQPVAVGAGQGLDVSAAGVVTPRPISPSAAQNITVTNTAAAQATGEVSLSDVSDSMTQATTEAGEPDSGGDSAPAEEGGTDGGAEESGGSGEPVGETSAESTTDSAMTESSVPSETSAPNVDTSQVLENNTEATQSRKTGKVNPLSKIVSQFGLTDRQAEIFYSFGASVQGSLVSSGAEVTKRLIDMTDKGVLEVHLQAFYAYSEEIRAKMLGLTDEGGLSNLLLKQYEESWLTGMLTDQSLLALNTENPPDSTSVTTRTDSFLALADKLRESGNSDVMEDLLELGGGFLTDELLLEGEVANRLLGDFTTSGSLAAAMIVDGTDALANRLYQDVSVLYRALANDLLVAGAASFIGARSMTLGGGEYSLDNLVPSGSDSLVFGAVDKLTLQGEISFSGDAGSGKRIVLMSGNELQGSNDLTLDAATNDLVLSVAGDVALEGATAELPIFLRGAREVTIHSMRNAHLQNTEVSASQQATIKAAKELYVDNMRFNAELPKIVMEATTIRLSNVTFPAGAAVRLNSLKGAIDGRYPNFGTNVSAAQQLGRVNFLQNVKSGGNLLHDRPSFDSFGGNINIGKLR